MSDEHEHNGLTELRLAHICEIMRAFKWRRGKTGPELAEEWGLSLVSVERLSAEASKRIKAEVTDKDYVTATVCGTLEKIMSDARGDADRVITLETERGLKQESPNVSRKVAVDAAKTWAEISGAKAPTQVEDVTPKNERDSVDTLTAMLAGLAVASAPRSSAPSNP